MSTLQVYDSLNNIIDYSKADLISLADKQSVEIIESGSSKQAYAFLYKVKTVIETTLDKIKESTINEVTKGNNSAFGVSMKVQSNAVYSYKHDPKWVELKKALTDYEELMKDKLGKYANMNLVDDQGELKDVKPAVKKTSEFIRTEF
jgi:hypothetical protein